MNILEKLKIGWSKWSRNIFFQVPGSKLEKKIKITFKNPSLLKEAMSFKSEKQEQLEFIGDAVLGLVISDLLCKMHPDLKEGELTVARSNLVNRKILAHKFRSFGLIKYFNTPAGMELSDKFLCNAFESLLGAIYLDQGYSFSYSLVKRWFIEELFDIRALLLRDYKTELQELMQKKGLSLPAYQVEEKNGLFLAVLNLNGVILNGIGNTRKNAEQEVASKGVNHLKNLN